MNDLTAAELDTLRHMVSANAHTLRRNWGYRNHFAASDSQKKDLENLVSGKFVTEGSSRGELTFYFITKLGCEAIGLSKAATERALYEQ